MADKRSHHTVTPSFTQRLDANLHSYFARTRIVNSDRGVSRAMSGNPGFLLERGVSNKIYP